MDLTTQIEQWVVTKNYEELQKCEFVVEKTLRQWAHVVKYMEENKNVQKDQGFLTIAKELKRLRLAVKMVDLLFGNRDKEGEFK